jgi:hypothetical protein
MLLESMVRYGIFASFCFFVVLGDVFGWWMVEMVRRGYLYVWKGDGMSV